MKTFRFYLIIICLVFITNFLYSTDLKAIVQEANGKVEVKRGGAAWESVKVGDILSSGDSISTGFNSKAVLVLGDTSVLVAKDLTRLTLAELYEKEGTVVTDLFLDIGNIRAEVHSSDEVSNDFQVRNANSTASVRGTVLDVAILGDGRGMKVMAWDGMALVTDIRSGRKAQVGEAKKKKDEKAGQDSEESGDGESEDSGSGESGSDDGTDSEGGGSGADSETGAANMGMPSEPPAEIAAAPLMASGNGGGMVSSMASAIAASTVTVSTKPPSPAVISTGGGTSASTETAAAAVVEEIIGGTTLPVITTSSVSIQVVWPE